MKYRFYLCLCTLLAICPVDAANRTFNQSQEQMLANLQIQQDQLQGQVQELTGLIDELQHALKQMQQQMAQLNPEAETTKEISSISTPAPKPQASLNSSAGLPSGSAQEHYAQARTLLDKRDFAGAEKKLRDFLAFHPDSPLEVNVRYWLAETYYIRDNHQQAATEFGEAYKAYQRFANKGANQQAAQKAPEILLKMALSLKAIGNKKAALVTLTQLKKEFPAVVPNLREQAERLSRDIGSSE